MLAPLPRPIFDSFFAQATPTLPCMMMHWKHCVLLVLLTILGFVFVFCWFLLLLLFLLVFAFSWLPGLPGFLTPGPARVNRPITGKLDNYGQSGNYGQLRANTGKYGHANYGYAKFVFSICLPVFSRNCLPVFVGLAVSLPVYLLGSSLVFD